MISAFGIIHKGLPRYLKDIAPVIGASGTRTFQGGRPLSRGDHTYLRVRAHQAGKRAARSKSEWDKLKPTKGAKLPSNLDASEAKWTETHSNAAIGRLAREGSRKAIKDNTYTRPKKPLP